MAVLGSVAAALLCLGGFGAVVYGAGPGDALYGLRTALFGEQQVTRDDQVALAAQTEMQEVQQLIDQGNWDAAQDKLRDASRPPSQTVEDPQQQQELRHSVAPVDGEGGKTRTRTRRCRRARRRSLPNASVPLRWISVDNHVVGDCSSTSDQSSEIAAAAAAPIRRCRGQDQGCRSPGGRVCRCRCR